MEFLYITNVSFVSHKKKIDYFHCYFSNNVSERGGTWLSSNSNENRIDNDIPPTLFAQQSVGSSAYKH